jgi:hypothetical protein
MEVQFRPETESRLHELMTRTGQSAADVLEDALAGYLVEETEVREMLDSRYDDIKSGRVVPLDGEEVFRQLKQMSGERRTSRR